MAPLSPTPLTPSSLITERCSVSATSIGGGVLQYYKNVHAIFSALPESYGDHLPRLRGIEETIANLPSERFCRDQAVFGDAAEVVDRLEAARGAAVESCRDAHPARRLQCWLS